MPSPVDMPRTQRNAIADVIIAALHDRAARPTLVALARVLEAEGRVVIDATSAAHLRHHGIVTTSRGAATRSDTRERPHGSPRERATAAAVELAPAFARVRAAAAARVHAACEATDAYWQGAGRQSGEELAIALRRAAALFGAGLYFEVHEELEPVWGRSAGATRAALQGLIQIAVALHHAERGNVAGARRLLAAGRAKVEPHAPLWQGIAIDTLLDDLRRWERACLDEGRATTPPRLVLASLHP